MGSLWLLWLSGAELACWSCKQFSVALLFCRLAACICCCGVLLADSSAGFCVVNLLHNKFPSQQLRSLTGSFEEWCKRSKVAPFGDSHRPRHGSANNRAAVLE